LRRILALPGAGEQPAALRAAALGAVGSVAYWRADYPEISRAYDAALAAARESEEPAVLAEALYNVGFARGLEAGAGSPERYPDAIAAFTESAAMWRDAGDRRGLANALWGLGVQNVFTGDYDKAEEHLREAQELYADLGDDFGMGWTLHELGIVHLVRGRLEAADLAVREATARFTGSSDRSALVLMLVDFAVLSHHAGDEAWFWRLSAAARRAAAESGTGLIDVPFGIPDAEIPTAPPDEPPEAREWWQEGESWTPDEAIAHALEDRVLKTAETAHVGG